MKIAIIGANSNLSQALIKQFVEGHHSCSFLQIYNKNVDRLLPDFPSINIEGFLKIEEHFDVIYYIASKIDFLENSNVIKEVFEQNVLLLKVISEKFPTSYIIHTSSVSVFGNCLADIIDEKTLVNPQSSYAQSKLWAEKIIETHPAGGCNVRISSLFGPDMNENTLLPKIIVNALTKKQILLFGNGQRLQNYISYNKAAYYLKKIGEKKIDVNLILLVDDFSYSNSELASKIIQKFTFPVDIVFEGNDFSCSFVYNNSLLKRLLGETAKYNFENELIQTVEWFQKKYLLQE